MAQKLLTEVMKSMGLRAWTGTHAGQMGAFHRHDDIEVNYVHEGSMTYLLGPSRTTIRPRQFTLFWAGLPHLTVKGPVNTRVTWVTLPLSWVLQWQLPDWFLQSLVNGHMMSGGGEPELDELLLKHWEADLSKDDPAAAEVVAMEIQARVRRMAMQQPAQQKQRRHRTDESKVGKVEQMTGFIAQHYAEPITVADIAAHAKLHPNYAMTLFRQTCGLSLMNYVVRHRISHAQRLLATSDMPILDVAMDAGFGSLSRFYEAFGSACGCTPKAYRKRLQVAGS